MKLRHIAVLFIASIGLILLAIPSGYARAIPGSQPANWQPTATPDLNHRFFLDNPDATESTARAAGEGRFLASFRSRLEGNTMRVFRVAFPLIKVPEDQKASSEQGELAQVSEATPTLQPEEKPTPTPTRTPKPTSTPIPTPPPYDPGRTNLMIGFSLLVVMVILMGLWVNRQRVV